MRFIPVSSPDGRSLGWISPEQVVSIDSSRRYFKFKDGDYIRNGVVPYGMADNLVTRACGIPDDPQT